MLEHTDRKRSQFPFPHQSGRGLAQRVVARLGPADRLDGLEYIGIDELSYRRHHEYITTVVDHVATKVVWAAPGKNADTVAGFFKDLGPERAAKLKVVTMDMSTAYIAAVEKGASQARIVFDRFHVQRMAQEAVDKVRREQVRLLAGSDDATALKKTRFALLKNPWNLTAVEHGKLVDVQRDNRTLYRAYHYWLRNFRNSLKLRRLTFWSAPCVERGT